MSNRITKLVGRFALALLSLPVVALAGDKIRVACVGDSITFGAGIESPETNAYPAVLGRLLGDGFDVRNFGVSGATLQKKGDLPYWGCPEFEDVTRFDPQVVVIMLGSNDSKLQNWHEKEAFIGDLREFVDHFLRLPGGPKIWLCRPPPAFGLFFAIRDSVLEREVIPSVDQVAREKALGIIDVHALLAGKPDLFSDGIHPNAEGARLIAVAVQQALSSPVASQTPGAASKVE
jgi:acyl-CoA thioesterase I